MILLVYHVAKNLANVRFYTKSESHLSVRLFKFIDHHFIFFPYYFFLINRQRLCHSFFVHFMIEHQSIMLPFSFKQLVISFSHPEFLLHLFDHGFCFFDISFFTSKNEALKRLRINFKDRGHIVIRL